MKLRRLAALLVPAVAAVAFSAPASAEETHPTVYVGPPVNAAGVAVIQVNAGPKTWNIKQAARRLDAQVDGVTIRTSGDCSTATLCVDVKVDWYDPTEQQALGEGHVSEWLGLTAYPAVNRRVIHLNTYGTGGNRLWRKHIAAHEMGHVLGLAHHTSRGLMTVDQQLLMDKLHHSEVAVLDAYFANPNAY